MSTSPIPPILDQDRYAVYQPTAATTDFALRFPLFGEAADIAVYLNGNLLTLGTDYTVRSTANGASLTPSPVTDAYVRLSAPISSGKLEIYGNFRPRRTIQATAPYGTRDFNFAFSLLMAAMREMWSKFTRALKVPVGEEDLTIPSSADRAGQVLAFDLAGKPAVGGRYVDLMASASTATIAAANAYASAMAAAASAAAAATFNPSTYSTTTQIEAMLADYVPTIRTIASGTGILINSGASATLGDTVTVSLDYATNAETVAGVLTGKPTHPAGVHAAIMAALGNLIFPAGLKGSRVITASGTYIPSAGVTAALVFVVGGGGGGGGTNGSYQGRAGGMALGYVAVSGPMACVVGAGGGSNAAGGSSSLGGVSASGGAAGRTDNTGAHGVGTAGDLLFSGASRVGLPLFAGTNWGCNGSAGPTAGAQGVVVVWEF